MSVKAMTWAWEQDLKPGPKFVLVALADHSDGNGVCWPGHELIADKCGLSRQTVVEHIGFLERAAPPFLHAERTRDTKGREGKARYYLHLERLSTQPPVSEIPTRSRVGISDDPESGFPSAYKEEPKALEPTPNPRLLAIDGDRLRAWFDVVFWPEYPKKVAKAEAFTELERLKPDETLVNEIATGLAHRIAAQAAASSKGTFFPAWPDAHRWLRKRRWADRFDVPRETSASEQCVSCGAPGVFAEGRKWYCRSHNPQRAPETRPSL